MRYEYINFFVNSAKLIFDKEIHINLERSGIGRRKNTHSSMPVSILIGIKGPIYGQVIYSMDWDFAYSVATAMTGKKQPHEVGEMVQSAVCELANMITGQASIGLAGDDKLIKITTPSIITHPERSFDAYDIPTVFLSFNSSIGQLELNLALQSQVQEVEHV